MISLKKHLHVCILMGSALILVFPSACKKQQKKETQKQKTELAAEKKSAAPSAGDTMEKDEPQRSTITESNKKEMVRFEGGTFIMGSENGPPDQQPEHETKVQSFYLDKHPVTVAEFRQFIEETGYTTDAESFGDAGVFLFNQNRWDLVKGANWEYPQGPSKPKAKPDHPVTQVSWRDAREYCRWAGKRLPTEKQWEYAAKNGGKLKTPFPWGSNQLQINGEYKANVWQGDLQKKQGADGFKLTSPVGYYGAYKSGLSDMAGNVWEWCRDIYAPYPGSSARIRKNPKVRGIRGGSFFYDQAGKASYTVTFRGKNSIETSLFNMGFRCAKSAENNQ